MANTYYMLTVGGVLGRSPKVAKGVSANVQCLLSAILLCLLILCRRNLDKKGKRGRQRNDREQQLTNAPKGRQLVKTLYKYYISEQQ